MSEKQFTLTDWHEVKDNEKIMTVDEVVGKLNEQQSTIKQLQRICETINSLYNKINHLKEENEQLLRYKYFVKAVEVFTDCPISETIADYSDGELFDEEEQLEFGKKMLEQEKRVG